MDRAALVIPATEANRSFSRLLRAARQGARITITSHGEPVAELGPVGGASDLEAAERQRRRDAHTALLKHLRTVEPVTIEPWTRNELHERG
ncbi:MAG TPA: type II toxin-antitoxin system prevent-host-death family antitoxin [Caulobacteraceae bacterium]|nr:type II toxin-antitoxin system prevent-host-death family antitoxin [Caulobacteraceae bacterium]